MFQLLYKITQLPYISLGLKITQVPYISLGYHR